MHGRKGKRSGKRHGKPINLLDLFDSGYHDNNL
jgi:hypothetical protein